MAIKGLFRALQKAFCGPNEEGLSKDSVGTTPPTCESSQEAEGKITRFKKFWKRKSPPVPRWNWTNTQCRAWLVDLCVNFLQFSPEEARAKADEFHGFGPTIFMMDLREWQTLLGKQQGKGVFALSKGSWFAKSGAPRGLSGMHGDALIVRHACAFICI